MQKAAKAYFQTQVATTSQGKLLLMLYDGCIKFLNQAKVKIEERDYAQKGILISKALDVINELDSSLNADKGGELAENLHKLYFYCSTRLLNANLKMDIGYIDEVIKILSGLRSAYAQIIDTPEATAAAAMTTPVQSGQTHVQHAGTGMPKAPAFGTKGPMPKAHAFAAPSPQGGAYGPAAAGTQHTSAALAGLASSKGAAGPIGPNGATGPIGPNEAAGPIGPKGATGQAKPAASAIPSAFAGNAASAGTTGPEKAPGTPPAAAKDAVPAQAQQEQQKQQAGQPDDQPLNLAGRRLNGAAMYRKIASHNTP